MLDPGKELPFQGVLHFYLKMIPEAIDDTMINSVAINDRIYLICFNKKRESKIMNSLFLKDSSVVAKYLHLNNWPGCSISVGDYI